LHIPCAIIGMTELMAQPWREGLPYAMEILGMFGSMPALFGAIWLRHAWGERPGFPAYEVRAAPLLLTAGIGLVALGLHGAALDPSS